MGKHRIGIDEGDVCNRDGCTGTMEIEAYPELGCTCFLCPPCAGCIEAKPTCTVCCAAGEEGEC